MLEQKICKSRASAATKRPEKEQPLENVRHTATLEMTFFQERFMDS